MSTSEQQAKVVKDAARRAFEHSLRESTYNYTITRNEFSEVEEPLLDILSRYVRAFIDWRINADLYLSVGGEISELMEVPDFTAISEIIGELYQYDGAQDTGIATLLNEQTAKQRLKRGEVRNGLVSIIKNEGKILTPARIGQLAIIKFGDIPPSTITGGLSVLVNKKELKRVKLPESGRSFYGLPDWFDGNTPKVEFLDSESEDGTESPINNDESRIALETEVS